MLLKTTLLISFPFSHVNEAMYACIPYATSEIIATGVWIAHIEKQRAETQQHTAHVEVIGSEDLQRQENLNFTSKIN